MKSHTVRCPPSSIPLLAVFALACATAAFGQQAGTQLWAFGTGGPVLSSPAVAGDGTVYVGAVDGNLYAINPDGTQKWKVPTGGKVYSSPAIAPNGNLYFGSYDSNVYCLSPTGAVQWRFATRGPIFSSPALGPDGTVYIGSQDKALYALEPSGSQRWAFPTGDEVMSSPAIGPDGTLYVGSLDDKLYAVGSDGVEKWAFTTGNWITSSPAVAADGTIYVVSLDSHLYALDPTGHQKWTYPLQTHQFYFSPSAAVGPDGTVYVGDFINEVLHAINPDGTRKWDYVNPAMGGEGYTTPAIAADGTVYMGVAGSLGTANRLVAISPQGVQVWEFDAASGSASAVFSSPAIGPDGTVYFGAGTDTYTNLPSGTSLYAVRGGAALAAGQWPMFRRDLAHTADLAGALNPPSSTNLVLGFNGTGAYATVSSAAELQNSNALTLAAWVDPQLAAGSSDYFICKGDGLSATTQRSYDVVWNPPGTVNSGLNVEIFVGQTNYAGVNVPGVPANQWVQVAAVVDAVGGSVSVFTNGVLAAVATNDVFGVPLRGLSLRQTTLPVVFGRVTPTYGPFAAGYLDEVSIWTRALSAEEIRQAFSCRLSGSEPGLAAYWNFDTGTPVDLTGHGHDGTLAGGAAIVPIFGSDVVHAGCGTPCLPSAATATATVVVGFVVGINVTDEGCGYTNAPLVEIVGGGGTGATAIASVTNGVVTGVTVTDAGIGYTNPPLVVIASPPFAPWLSVAVSQVAVTEHVSLGHTYLVESSTNLQTWTPAGSPFTAQSEVITQWFDLNETPGLFRIREVP